MQSVLDKLATAEKERDHYKLLYEKENENIKELQEFKDSVIKLNSIYCIE